MTGARAVALLRAGRRGTPRSSTARRARYGRLQQTRVVFAFTITSGTITAGFELIADPEYIARLGASRSSGAEARPGSAGQ